jgi:hypothetical protein
LKFGDVVTAVASLVLINMLLDAVFLGVFITVNSYYGPDIASIISILLASLIVGYVFAAKINEESRRGAISKIAILSTVVSILVIFGLFTNPYMGTAINEGLESTFSTGGWTTMDWVAYSEFIMLMLVAMNTIIILAFSFIGLYAGSMLRKPKKI